MAKPNLPVNVDTTYADSGSDPSVQAHQAHHDKIHAVVNLFDAAPTPTQGQVLTWDSTSGSYLPAAPGAVSYASVPAGYLIVVSKNGSGFWPTSYAADGTPSYTGGSGSSAVRPTGRTDVRVAWDGPDPSPAFVASGTGGMLIGVDFRWKRP